VRSGTGNRGAGFPPEFDSTGGHELYLHGLHTSVHDETFWYLFYEGRPHSAIDVCDFYDLRTPRVPGCILVAGRKASVKAPFLNSSVEVETSADLVEKRACSLLRLRAQGIFGDQIKGFPERVVPITGIGQQGWSLTALRALQSLRF
jgi:hypothetical protein